MLSKVKRLFVSNKIKQKKIISKIKNLFFSKPIEKEKHPMTLWIELLEGKLVLSNNFKVNFNIEQFIINSLTNYTPQILNKKEVPDYEYFLSLLKNIPHELEKEVFNFIKAFHYLKYSQKDELMFEFLDRGCYVCNLQATYLVFELRLALITNYVPDASAPSIYEDRINNYIGTFFYNYLNYQRLEPYLKNHKESIMFNKFLETGKVP